MILEIYRHKRYYQKKKKKLKVPDLTKKKNSVWLRTYHQGCINQFQKEV